MYIYNPWTSQTLPFPVILLELFFWALSIGCDLVRQRQ